MEGGAPKSSSSFNCNICLDSVSEPVVTLCGHLFCWSCIYNWLHYHRHTATAPPTCPACKSPVSDASLIPLYGQSPSTINPGIPDRRSLIQCTTSRGKEEEDHLVMNNTNYGTWVNDENFRKYCGIAGLAIGLKYECPYRRLSVYGARQEIWVEMWLRLLLFVLLGLVVLCVLWF